MDNKNLRQFGCILSGYFILFYTLLSITHHRSFQLNEEWIFLPIVVSTFFIFPGILIPVKMTWDFILKVLNWINTRIVLGIIFFCIFSPIAFFKKIMGKNTFALGYDANLKSYRTEITEDNDIRKPY